MPLLGQGSQLSEAIGTDLKCHRKQTNNKLISETIIKFSSSHLLIHTNIDCSTYGWVKYSRVLNQEMSKNSMSISAILSSKLDI